MGWVNGLRFYWKVIKTIPVSRPLDHFIISMNSVERTELSFFVRQQVKSTQSLRTKNYLTVLCVDEPLYVKHGLKFLA